MKYGTCSEKRENSEEARERRVQKRAVKEREQKYKAKLLEWEAREKKMVSTVALIEDTVEPCVMCGLPLALTLMRLSQSKRYEREEEKAKQKRLDAIKEAKKLRVFLEDYDDERQDSKFYK